MILGHARFPVSSSRDALHRSIARTLRDEIADGRPEVGQTLPPEHDLVSRFGSSRHTVREALRTLAREGLIERRQGATTRVIASHPRGPYQPTMHSIDDLRQYAAETVLRLHDVWTAPLAADEAAYFGEANIGEATGAHWLQVDAVRWAGPQALCSNRVFIDVRFAPLLADLAPGAALTIGINEMVCSRGGTKIARVEQDVLARPMPAMSARHLGLKPGAMALLFVRRYVDRANCVIVWSLNWHPADRFVYRMRMERGPD